MKSSLKRFNVVLVLAVVLALLLVQVPNAYSAELTTQEKVLTFLRDVVRLDMTKYDAKLVTVPVPSDLDGLGAMGWVKYTLTSPGSKIDVLCNFRNNALVWCKLRVIAGSPLYAQSQPANVLDAAKGLLQRYQTYSGASYLQPMKNMLDTANELKPMTTTSGNVKLKISIEGNYTYIKWMYTVNGLDVSLNAVSFIFNNGALDLFRDSWNLYKVGNTDVNVSEEEAIRIAREHAQNYSYTVGGVPVSNFTILDEPVIAKFSMQDRGNYTLYPHWEIRLCLDKVYPAAVTGIQVMLWADTGEVTHITPIGSLGGPPPEDSTDPPVSSTEPSPTPQQTPKPPQQQSGFLGTSLPMEYGYAIVAVIVVAIAAATGYLYLKRKK